MNDSDSTVSAYSQTKQTNNNNHHDDSMKHQKLFLVVIPFSVSSHRKLPSWTSTLNNIKAFNNSHVRTLTCKPASHAPFTVLESLSLSLVYVCVTLYNFPLSLSQCPPDGLSAIYVREYYMGLNTLTLSLCVSGRRR